MPSDSTITPVKSTKSKERKERKKYVPLTLESYQKMSDDLLSAIDTEILRLKSTQTSGVKFLKSVRKNVISMRDKAPKLAKQKRKNLNSGLKIEREVTDELRNFLKLEPNQKISRVDATRGITAYINIKKSETRPTILRWQHLNPNSKRNLQLQQDKNGNGADATKIIPDAALSKLLKYDEYVKNVKDGKVFRNKKNDDGVVEKIVETDPSLRYYTIQKLIQHHFV